MMNRRIDYYDDPNAPAAQHVVPSAGVIVTNDNGDILMIRRSDNDYWAIPGGAMDIGESIADCAIREVKEETGIDCDITGLVGVYTNPRHIIEYTRDGETRQEFSLLFTGRPVGGDLATS